MILRLVVFWVCFITGKKLGFTTAHDSIHSHTNVQITERNMLDKEKMGLFLLSPSLLVRNEKESDKLLGSLIAVV